MEIEIEQSDKAIREAFSDKTDKACMDISAARSPILNVVSALMGDAGFPTVNKAKLYLELNELASVVAKAKKEIREHLEFDGDDDYDVGRQICEVRITKADSLDSAAWKRDDPRGYALTKMDYSKESKRVSVKFRDKKGI